MTLTRWQRALPWLLLLAGGGAAAWLRYGFIESHAVTQLCDAGQMPWWCGVRHALVLGFLYGIYGIVALFAALLALRSKNPWLAWLAAVLGAMALLLYCFETGALALLIGCLRLLRLHDPAGVPAEQDRHRDRKVQTQP
ncbi:MAG: hypothetical protein ABI870_00445 [Rhodanobacter sp.]